MWVAASCDHSNRNSVECVVSCGASRMLARALARCGSGRCGKGESTFGHRIVGRGTSLLTYRWDGVSPEGWSGVGSVDARPLSGGAPGLWSPGQSAVVGGREAQVVSWTSSSFSILQAIGSFEHGWQSDDALSHSFEHAGMTHCGRNCTFHYMKMGLSIPILKC